MTNSKFIEIISSEAVYQKRLSRGALEKVMKEFSQSEIDGFNESYKERTIPQNGYDYKTCQYEEEFNDRRIIDTLGSAIREIYFMPGIEAECGDYIKFIGTFWIILWNSLLEDSNKDLFNQYFQDDLIYDFQDDIINNVSKDNIIKTSTY